MSTGILSADDDADFLLSLSPASVHSALQMKAGRRYLRAFISGFFVAVPVTVTALDRLAYVARVEGASMQVKKILGSHVTFIDKLKSDMKISSLTACLKRWTISFSFKQYSNVFA